MATKTKQPAPPKHLAAKHQHKEVWLAEAMKFVRAHFEEAGYQVPEHVRVSTGWPSRGGLSKKKRTIGQAWHNSCSGDGVHEVIVSLWLDDPLKVLGVLIHEVVHVTVGVEHGHKKPFADCAKAVGLTKPWTATGESNELIEKLEQWTKKLGQYPHAKLDGGEKEKKGSRLLKCECPSCGCKIRVTATWIDEYGEFPCPCGDTLYPE
jgi:hypothetical protein